MARREFNGGKEGILGKAPRRLMAPTRPKHMKRPR